MQFAQCGYRGSGRSLGALFELESPVGLESGIVAAQMTHAWPIHAACRGHPATHGTKSRPRSLAGLTPNPPPAGQAWCRLASAVFPSVLFGPENELTCSRLRVAATSRIPMLPKMSSTRKFRMDSLGTATAGKEEAGKIPSEPQVEGEIFLGKVAAYRDGRRSGSAGIPAEPLTSRTAATSPGRRRPCTRLRPDRRCRRCSRWLR
jgi:hypothetical protein